MPDNTVQEIPGPSRFAVRGAAFELDLLDTIYELHDIADEIRAAGGTQRDYLKRVVQFVAGQSDVDLTLGEADWLNDNLEIEFAAAKKKRRDCIVAALPSPSSTDSTPAD